MLQIVEVRNDEVNSGGKPAKATVVTLGEPGKDFPRVRVILEGHDADTSLIKVSVD